jgi:hypothetical protein
MKPRLTNNTRYRVRRPQTKTASKSCFRVYLPLLTCSACHHGLRFMIDETVSWHLSARVCTLQVNNAMVDRGTGWADLMDSFTIELSTLFGWPTENSTLVKIRFSNDCVASIGVAHQFASRKYMN